MFGSLFVGECMCCLRCLCLLQHSGVQHILCCVFGLFFFVYVASFSGLSFLDCPFGILELLFTAKTNDWAIRTPLKTGSELRCSFFSYACQWYFFSHLIVNYCVHFHLQFGTALENVSQINCTLLKSFHPNNIHVIFYSQWNLTIADTEGTY